MTEGGKEFLGCLGRAIIVLLIVGVVFFGLIAGVCGVAIFTSR
jgi:hypothetical protein